MFGLAMLGIITTYLVVALFITLRIPSKRWRWFAAAVFVLIPTGDTAVGYVYFRYLCATEAGNKIYKTADNVDGFYGAGGDAYFKYGYLYTEDHAPDGSYRRWTLDANRRKAWQTVETLKSRFGTRYSTDKKPLDGYIDRYEIYDIQSNETYAINQSVRYRGGWIATAPGRLIGIRSGWHFYCCGGSTTTDLLLKTLHPAK